MLPPLICMPFPISFRYGRSWKHWFSVHKKIQLCASCLTTPLAVVALVHKYKNGASSDAQLSSSQSFLLSQMEVSSDYSLSLHGAVGLLVSALSFLQVEALLLTGPNATPYFIFMLVGATRAARCPGVRREERASSWASRLLGNARHHDRRPHLVGRGDSYCSATCAHRSPGAWITCSSPPRPQAAGFTHWTACCTA